MMETPIPPSDSFGAPEPKKNRTGLIIGIVLVVLCCCCLVFLGLAWTFGDLVLESLRQF